MRHVGRRGKETASVFKREVPRIQQEATFIKLSSLFPPPPNKTKSTSDKE